jgi:hypothetical protein
MKPGFAWTNIATSLFALALVSCAAPSMQDELVLANQTFEADTEIEVRRLVIRAGAQVRITHSALLWIRADELVIEGDVIFDGRGEDGAPGVDWTSSGSCLIAHHDYVDAAAALNPTLDLGGAGSPGASVEIRYHELPTGSGSLASIHANLEGGVGGHGKTVRCGCQAPPHDTEHTDAPNGPNGPDGALRVVAE